MKRLKVLNATGLWENNPPKAYIIEPGDEFDSIWDVVGKEDKLNDTQSPKASKRTAHEKRID